MKVLITGGAGFIGSHLAERHLERGDEVFVIDDLSTGSIENILPLKRFPTFHYVIDTVTNAAQTAELLDLCDVAYHLAAAVGVKLIVESPVRTIETNIRGTEVVLELAAKKGKRVIVASTSEVYGKRDVVPFNENDDLILGATSKARWAYACSKAIDEFLALAYWREKNVPTVIVRLFNTVGPRQTGRYGMVIPTFVQQALADRDITVYGDGTQRRCFGHVSDVIDGLMSLAVHPDAVGQVFNLGSQEEVSILALAERIRERTGSKSKIVMVPYDEAYQEGFEDMLRRVPDTAKARDLVGFRATKSLDEIIDSVVQYERSKTNGKRPSLVAGGRRATDRRVPIG
ncbi:MAG: GDP-mannose 4,6-dehydratase [Gemmatimonadales bacterium]